ncbi:MAG: helix-turn-helix domain-containing protein [Methanomassiliicoccales archaeon]
MRDRTRRMTELEGFFVKKRKAEEALQVLMRFFNFKKAEISLYGLLLKSPLTIKEIQERMKVSERSIRKYLKKLEEEGFIVKRVVQGKRLKYVYQSVHLEEAWNKLDHRIRKTLSDFAEAIAK